MIMNEVSMKDLLKWMKEVYVQAKENNFEWKKIYPNNMVQNGIEGIYTDMFFEVDGKYRYVKYSISVSVKV